LGPTNYGMIKYEMEQRIKHFFRSWLIFRLGGVVGPGLKKNVVFDLKNKKKVYLTKDSVLNFISTKKIAEIISTLLSKDRYTTGTINLVACDGITVEEIARLANYIPPAWGEEKQDYSLVDCGLCKNFWNVGTSREYVLEYLLGEERR
jgi:dTDP-4-dehydrorhamnose reductase